MLTALLIAYYYSYFKSLVFTHSLSTETLPPHTSPSLLQKQMILVWGGWNDSDTLINPSTIFSAGPMERRAPQVLPATTLPRLAPASIPFPVLHTGYSHCCHCYVVLQRPPQADWPHILQLVD